MSEAPALYEAGASLLNSDVARRYAEQEPKNLYKSPLGISSLYHKGKRSVKYQIEQL
ncbi:MAG: hypothetical protein LUE98_14240 [Tannerellaceae bacterium]|nr:hypothetical protein [Tannerellaceae bacterium]